MYNDYELEVLAEINAQEFNPVLNEYRLVQYVSFRNGKSREISLILRRSGRATSWHLFPFDTAATELDTPIWASDPVKYFKDSLLQGRAEPDS